MVTVLLALILVGALLALAAAVVALRAYLRLRRVRIRFQDRLSAEVARLVLRTGELEEGLSALDARARRLPIHIYELQQNLATLRVLAGTLATSLRQAQKVLSYSQLRLSLSARIADLLATLPARRKARG